MKSTDEMKMEGWRPFKTAPDGVIVLLLLIEDGKERVTSGQWDAMEGAFYGTGEHGPVVLNAVAWKPVPDGDWKPIMHVAGSTVAVLIILLMIYCSINL